jgi:hypothetical protein
MGCNCGKAAATRQQQSVRQAPKPPARPSGPAAVSVPGKPMKGVTQAFTLTFGDGRTQTFGSALEAQAALVRAGGSGVVS